MEIPERRDAPVLEGRVKEYRQHHQRQHPLNALPQTVPPGQRRETARRAQKGNGDVGRVQHQHGHDEHHGKKAEAHGAVQLLHTQPPTSFP